MNALNGLIPNSDSGAPVVRKLMAGEPFRIFSSMFFLMSALSPRERGLAPRVHPLPEDLEQ
jgi:hypothetical protein